MKHLFLFMAIFLCMNVAGKEKFPDGTTIPDWFYQYDPVDVASLGKAYRITDYGVVANDSNLIQTQAIQAVIDKAAAEGGGVVVIPRGTFLSDTRIEGQSLKYFAALVNADGVNGFTITGKGTINGNGLRYWKSFWLRRKVIPKCTNMDELRPRLVHISNCKDVQLEGVSLINSPFWTTHLYKCENVKLFNLHIFAPSAPVKAPSSDAIDIDVCTNVLVKGCYLSVNDDAIALKGGKGPWADKDKNNGGNYNIIIEDCVYGFCHSALTCGSESVHDRNIILRRIKINNASRLLWLKMRPDTPQNYEYITVEEITGTVSSFLYAKPWTQFFDLQGREDIPYSYSSHVTMRNITMECDVVFDVVKSEDQYKLSNFTFENLNLTAKKKPEIQKDAVEGFTLKNVTVNGKKVE